MKIRNHMKFHKFDIFVKKKLNIKMLKIKMIVKLGNIVMTQSTIEVLHMVF